MSHKGIPAICGRTRGYGTQWEEGASENLDLKYKVNGDLLLLIRTDLPCGNTQVDEVVCKHGIKEGREAARRQQIRLVWCILRRNHSLMSI